MFSGLHAASSVLCVFAVALLVGCGSKPQPAAPPQVVKPPEVWQSEHHPVWATLGNGWAKAHLDTPGDTIDDPDKLIMSFVNADGPYSYVVRVEPDAPLEQLSMEVYAEAVTTQYTSAGFELIDAGDVSFHDRRWHRLRMRVVGTKGPLCQSVFVHRDGEHLTTIQWTFPLASDDALDLPTALQAFDDGVTLGSE